MTATDKRPPASSGWNLDHIGYRKCNKYTGTPPSGGIFTLKCYDGAIGQYVYLYMTQSAYMCVCEVEVYGIPANAPALPADKINRAAGQRTWQSSTNSYGASNLATDENFDVSWSAKSCIKTNYDDHAW